MSAKPQDEIPMMVHSLVDSLDRTFSAIIDAIHVASEKTAADAIESLCDYMNSADVVEEESVRDYLRWVERGRP